MSKAPAGNRFIALQPVPARPGVDEALSGLRSPQSALGSIAGGSTPGVPIAGPATFPKAVEETPLTGQWDEWLRDLFQGKARVPTFTTNGYFGKFTPQGVMSVRNTFVNDNAPMAPGDVNTVIAGFKIPNNMVLILTHLSFFANRSFGGTQTPIQPGETGKNLTYGVLDNGHQIGVQGVMFTPPTGGFTFGVYGMNQVPAVSPSNSFQAGPGEILDNGDVYYVQGTHELVFVASVLPALPYTVTSAGVAIEGVLIDFNSLEHRIQQANPR